MPDALERLEEYLRMSGQTEKEVFGGAWDYGYQHILDVLIPEALAERKRIIWYCPPERIDGAELRWEKID